MTGLRAGLHGATFLALGITLGAGTGGAAEVDSPMLNWDIAQIGPSRSVTVIFEETAKRLEQATDGKFKIKLHYNTQLAPEKEILEGLSVGAFQLGWVVPGYAPGKLLTASALDLPFLPAPDARALVAMSHAYLHIPETVADFGRWGTRNIHTVPLPVYEFMGKGKAEAVFKQKGVQQVNLAAAEREKLIAFAQPIWDKWVQDMTPKGIPGQKLPDFILDTAQKSKS